MADSRFSSTSGLSFTQAVDDQLNRAVQLCRARGARLTEARRFVLGLILSADRPIGAYDLLAQIRPVQPNAAPPTVYRALDFLLEQGLIHKLERLAAFVGCTHAMMCDDGCHHHDAWGVHKAQFLICHTCGRAWELEQEKVVPALMAAAEQVGFSAETATIEVEGVCADCKRAQETE
ncbi:transcriptional repressor [Neokomagataea tanensis]|uniref:Transcriptional repressor n=1 Tax=Neokomagataea tanensis TaxID=661191 RepID=A0A4Y6V366_9PROT|nr:MULTISPECIES: Fur family transcriptional regulator [Neokomagataea]QDH24489.1 transcriptional repressor [Neokomagataea tanensis]